MTSAQQGYAQECRGKVLKGRIYQHQPKTHQLKSRQKKYRQFRRYITADVAIVGTAATRLVTWHKHHAQTDTSNGISTAPGNRRNEIYDNRDLAYFEGVGILLLVVV
jgi:hypothetical protein